VNGLCDVAEKCPGNDNDCPTDGFVAANTVCRAAVLGAGGVLSCDVTERCSGTDNDCPPDAFVTAASHTMCRGSAGVCDVAEECNGLGATCPGDAFLPSTAPPCRPAAPGGTDGSLSCDVAEKCTGSNANCPGDSFLGSSTICRAAVPGANGDLSCDVADTCTGGSAACPVDKFQPATFVCRPQAAGDYCDADDTCSGSRADCPTTDTRIPSGKPCDGKPGTCQTPIGAAAVNNICCPGETTLTANGCELHNVDGVPVKVVFVTSRQYVGDVGDQPDITEADTECNKLAASANLGGTFTAWLSTDAPRVGDPINRIGAGPFYLLDCDQGPGTGCLSRVTSKAEILQRSDLDNPIHRSEWSEDLKSVDVWTGTLPDGTSAGTDATCKNWTSRGGGDKAMQGDSLSVKSPWTANTAAITCNKPAALYCFQD
jgi:hypothetical protein